MNLPSWSKSNLDYGRKLVHSGWEGARSGGEEFLHGEPLTPFLSDSVHHALRPAALGVCLGVLSTFPARRHHSASATFAYAFFGGVIGLTAGLVWHSRGLAENVASSAWKNIGKVRDEHWFEKHPIDYA
jgi:hypothetical protein